MSKYTNKLKFEIIMDILNNNISFNEAGRKYCIDHSLIIDWYKHFENNGMEMLVKKKRKYDGKFKQTVVEYKIKNNLSLRDTAIKFKIPGRRLIKTWEQIYYEEGPQALYVERRGRKRNMSSKPKKNKISNKNEKDLLAEIEELRMENEYLKKLNALVQERIKRESKKK